jgi:transcriptional regulator with XRE-family HTH domain
VRIERAQRRWTLDELAARSGVSRRLLVQIEHADANPSLATLLKLAAAFGVTLTDLIACASIAGRERPRPQFENAMADEQACGASCRR